MHVLCIALPSLPPGPGAGAASVPGWGRSSPPPRCGRVGLSAAWPRRGFGRVALTSGGCPPKDRRLRFYPALSPSGLSCGPGYSERCRSLRRPHLRSLSSSRRKPVASRRCSSLQRGEETTAGRENWGGGSRATARNTREGEKREVRRQKGGKNDIMQRDDEVVVRCSVF